MHNLFGNIHLTLEQKVAYLRVLSYILKNDVNASQYEREYIAKLVKRMRIPMDVMKTATVPHNEEELYQCLVSINTRALAIDLIHCLWFASSINSVITDEEIETIRIIAQILHIDEDTLFKIHNFVTDELLFFQHAQEILEVDEIRS